MNHISDHIYCNQTKKSTTNNGSSRIVWRSAASWIVERIQTAIEEENHGAEDIDEICVLRAFQDALGRMFTRGGELWLDNIPNDAILTMGDVQQVQLGKSIRVLEPQVYSRVTKLTNWHTMLEDAGKGHNVGVYGYFHTGEHTTCATEFLPELANTPALSGTGSDMWYKMTPGLVEYALKWEWTYKIKKINMKRIS